MFHPIFSGIDYKEVVTYLAQNLGDFEAQRAKIFHLLPKRKGKRGQKATVTGVSAMSGESSHDKHWIYHRLQFTDLEKRILFAKALEVATNVLFSNHLYQFGGKYYRQTDGGPIGVRASMSASRVVTGRFDKKLGKIIDENKLEVKTRMRYVDDLRLIMYLLKEGWRWIGDRMIFRKCWEKEEKTAEVNLELKTAEEMRKIMDSIFSNLKFEMETPTMFENGRLPTLDFELWTVGERILYSFYQKPMANKLLIHRKSALGENVKVASLTQNLVRRMKNTSEDVPDVERVKIVDEFYMQLRGSGYSHEQSRKVIKAGLMGYENLLSKYKKGEVKLHRSAQEGEETRRKKKLLGKANWFKSKGRKNSFNKSKRNDKKNISPETPEIVTVMFVSQTPRGELFKSLQKVENDMAKITGEKIKFVERSGTSIKDIFHKSNPWSGGNCGRKECLPCLNGDGKQNCFEKNVVYQINCLRCADSDKIYAYYGQTSRSLHERGQEHLTGLLKKHEDSPLYKHVSDVHQGEYVDFKMRVVKKHFTAFSRLVHESVMIDRASKNSKISIMNSKGEFGRCNLPRLVIEKDTKAFEANGETKNSLSTDVGEDKVKRVSKARTGQTKRKSSTCDVNNQLESQSSNSNSNFNLLQETSNLVCDVSKPNNLGGGDTEVKQTTRIKYKFVSTNFKFKRKLRGGSDV